MTAGRVTLLGGTGFLGRALAARLVEQGVAVRAVARHATAAVLPEGVEAFAGDVQDSSRMRQALSGADCVVYLPGVVREASGQTFRALHLDAPRACAAAAREQGATGFVFLSALGVGRDAPAAADRTKAEGEAAIAEAFPGATIVRPSLVFGPGDHFVTGTARLLTRLPAFPLLAGGHTRFQPVHVADLTAALAAMVSDPARQGRIYEIGGPETRTLAELVAAIRDAAGAGCRLVPLSPALSLVLAQALAVLPNPPVTPDGVRLLRTDKTVGGAHPGLASLGVDTPRRLAECLPEILRAADLTRASP